MPPWPGRCSTPPPTCFGAPPNRRADSANSVARNSSLTSLAVYAQPTFDPVAAATAALDPDRRH
jgi:hypothetical protein